MHVRCGSFFADGGHQKCFKTNFRLIHLLGSTKFCRTWGKLKYLLPTSEFRNVGKKGNCCTLAILLPIFSRLHGEIWKLFIEQIFNFLLLKRFQFNISNVDLLYLWVENNRLSIFCLRKKSHFVGNTNVANFCRLMEIFQKLCSEVKKECLKIVLCHMTLAYNANYEF